MYAAIGVQPGQVKSRDFDGLSGPSVPGVSSDPIELLNQFFAPLNPPAAPDNAVISNAVINTGRSKIDAEAPKGLIIQFLALAA